MGEPPILSVALELKLGTEPIAGWLRTPLGDECEFTGLLELIALLDRVREPAPGSPAAD